ncbi:hypothetical protein IU459_27150 [Nocardia amamiensis]|uniref:Lsr2 protein n=1 Tax=Nocardia amamiensis TaxID=404578 RepID=A0ABS0CX72_9NOCA|nr:hypothetical protein [Nocardia amamiensis]MBF6301194.1 hypothetical protein [Nocardia amamiensis]
MTSYSAAARQRKGQAAAPHAVPERRVQLVLEAHADSGSAMTDVLDDIAGRLDGCDFPHGTDLLEGGKHSGYRLRVDVDDAMTAERYQQELHDWHAAKKRLAEGGGLSDA